MTNRNYDRFGVGNHRREVTTMVGKKYFTKTFENRKWAEKYLAAVRRNARHTFYHTLKENKNKTYTLNLYRAEYWEE